MGEIAESMLNGELCEGCGAHIGEDSGYPMYCSESCAKSRGADVSQVVDEVQEGDELWAGLATRSKEKRAKNRQMSTALIEKWCKDYNGILMKFTTAHLRINERFDFWPGTGKYQDRATGQYRRGVFNLIKELDQHYNVQKV